jgi:amidase
MQVVVPASLIGLPALAVPAGFGAQGLPMGIQLIGPRASDFDLLELGKTYHKAADFAHKAPPL